MNDDVLKKWEFLINAGKAYWIDNVPTGLTDEVFAEWTAGVHGQYHEKLDERRACKIRPYV